MTPHREVCVFLDYKFFYQVKISVHSKARANSELDRHPSAKRVFLYYRFKDAIAIILGAIMHVADSSCKVSLAWHLYKVPMRRIHWQRKQMQQTFL